MDDEYDSIKKSSLKFKGEKKKRKKKHRNNEESNNPDGPSAVNPDAEDADDHGGWWKIRKFEHIKDDVAIEILPGCYFKALGNGKVVLGQPHPPGDGPDEEEIFTALSVGTNQIALKSGFGRYLAIDSKKRVVGLSEAIGELETFLPVFEDGKMALSAFNECFLSVDEDSEQQLIVARATKVGPNEILTIRINNNPSILDSNQISGASKGPDIGKIYEAELGYLKGSKNVSIDEEKKRLKKARLDGQLYETLLDTRVKKKSDKYCK